MDRERDARLPRDRQARERRLLRALRLRGDRRGAIVLGAPNWFMRRRADGSSRRPAYGALDLRRRALLDPPAQPEEVVGARDDRHRDRDVDERVDPERASTRTRSRRRSPPPGGSSSPCRATTAGITTPRSAATIRSTVTANSRAMITIATQGAIRSERHQRDQRRDDQQLVGERVHQLAEVRDAAARARDVAVERRR